MTIMHLVNQESVIVESVEVVRNGLARELGVNPKDVQIKIDFADNKVKPEFLVDKSVLAKFSDDDVRKSMAKVWLIVKEQMASRLNGLSVRRHG